MSDNDMFRYFADPHLFSTYETRPRECDICREVRPGYADAFITDSSGPEIRFVCEPDLTAGRLAQFGARANTGARFELEAQAATLHPDWSANEFDDYCEARNQELEVRTPSIPTWQEFEWPVHCAEYMRYIKEIGQEDCVGLGAESDGIGFLAAHVESDARSDAHEPSQAMVDLWNAMRVDSPKDSAGAAAAGFYLFQCLVCGEYLIEWDFDAVEHVATADEAEVFDE